ANNGKREFNVEEQKRFNVAAALPAHIAIKKILEISKADGRLKFMKTKNSIQIGVEKIGAVKIIRKRSRLLLASSRDLL
ncbi:MAG: hypothetical protein ACE5I1_30520, partial [bacterium]